MQTLKEYLTKPYSNTDTTSLWDDCISINRFYQELPEMQGQASFANYFKTRNIVKAPRGYVTLKAFFDPKNVGNFDGQVEAWMTDKNKFMQNYDNWKVDSAMRESDNTYNYQGLIEDDLAFNRITIVNPDSRVFESKDLLLLRANISLDPRGNYTPNVIAIFDNDLDDHYQAASFMGRHFSVLEAEFTVDGTKYYMDADTSALSDTYSCYFNTESSTNIFADNDQIDLYFDPTDKEDIIDTIKTAINDLTDLDVDKTDFELTNVKYFCESNN